MLRKFRSGRSRLVGNITTGDETWLHYYDPMSKPDSAEWVPQNKPDPTKVRSVKSAGKRMFALFFRRKGFVAKMMLPKGRTVNAHWYVRGRLTRLLRKVKDLRPNVGVSGVFLHHDNAPRTVHDEPSVFCAIGKSA